MPPLAPMQVRLGGAPSHTIPCQGYFVSAVALHSRTKQCICSAGQGSVQRCSTILQFDAEHGSLISPSVLKTVFTSLFELSAQSFRARSAWAVRTLVKMRTAIRSAILALILATAVTTSLSEDDPEIFDGCTADTYSVPTRQKISLFHQVNTVIIIIIKLTNTKLKHADTRDKFPITLWVLTKMKRCVWSVTSSRLSTRNLLSQYCICWHGFATFYFSFMPIWEFKLIRSPGNNIIHW